MEPLKEMFNIAYYKNFAAVIRKSYPAFDSTRFFKEVTANLESLALNQRLRNTSLVMRNYLPANFKKSVAILRDAAPALPNGYTALVLPDYIGLYGKEDINTSLAALEYFTQFGSSEFAIREFLRTDLEKTLRQMEKWAESTSHHVRRLASEGSRPRLPWSFRLEEVVKKPQLTRNILQALRADEHIYVKKSVANHLNDISKDHPAYMLQLVKGWDVENEHTRWIVKHACRTLIKKGDPAALEVFSFEKNVRVSVSSLQLSKSTVYLGDTLEFGFTLSSDKKVVQKLVIDYAVVYAKSRGVASRKVFKMKELLLAPGQSLRITKKQLFQNFTTRVHHSGTHTLQIIINGRIVAESGFYLHATSAALT